MAKIIVIVEVLVPRCQGVDPLSDQLLDGVLDQIRVAMIGETGRELADDAGDSFHLAKQQTAAI